MSSQRWNQSSCRPSCACNGKVSCEVWPKCWPHSNSGKACRKWNLIWGPHHLKIFPCLSWSQLNTELRFSCSLNREGQIPLERWLNWRSLPRISLLLTSSVLIHKMLLISYSFFLYLLVTRMNLAGLTLPFPFFSRGVLIQSPTVFFSYFHDKELAHTIPAFYFYIFFS